MSTFDSSSMSVEIIEYRSLLDTSIYFVVQGFEKTMMSLIFQCHNPSEICTSALQWEFAFQKLLRYKSNHSNWISLCLELLRKEVQWRVQLDADGMISKLWWTWWDFVSIKLQVISPIRISMFVHEKTNIKSNESGQGRSSPTPTRAHDSMCRSKSNDIRIYYRRNFVIPRNLSSSLFSVSDDSVLWRTIRHEEFHGSDVKFYSSLTRCYYTWERHDSSMHAL